jgi:succinate dehydrogenase / fumarate reductase membrane anchor subunit
MRSQVVQRGLTFEYIMWIFTRLSGLALIVLAFVGLVAALIMGARTQMDLGTLMRWTFFPNPNHVISSNIPDVTLGWANGFWQVMEMLLIVFGVTHGFNGLRVVVEDFTGPSFWQPIIRGLVFLLWLFVMIVAIYVILNS